MAKIVFCEDEALLQKLVRIFLRTTTHELHIASDGLEGLALIERERPDLILTDISMPRCDGFQLANIVKARPHLANIPLLFVTAFAQRADIAEGMQRGAIGYLLKPFSATDLQAAIETALLSRARRCIGESDEIPSFIEKH